MDTGRPAVTEMRDGKIAVDFEGAGPFLTFHPWQLRALIIAAGRAGVVDLRELARQP